MRTAAFCFALFLSGMASGAVVDRWFWGGAMNFSYIATSLLISVIVLASAIHGLDRPPVR